MIRVLLLRQSKPMSASGRRQPQLRKRGMEVHLIADAVVLPAPHSTADIGLRRNGSRRRSDLSKRRNGFCFELMINAAPPAAFRDVTALYEIGINRPAARGRGATSPDGSHARKQSPTSGLYPSITSLPTVDRESGFRRMYLTWTRTGGVAPDLLNPSSLDP